ncbi:hypothetical protein N7475_006758 [Penicillium sp. IBT 31633x]|nr:hypothetical protein N7475_006758 [Penicillium sp. IBT 31633x]
MPYPRPVSPISLEICAPLSPNIDSDDLLASDDELDDDVRAAKRQRIEKLAETYLQGKPLPILSASLKGPFNNEWVNPWKKNRVRGKRTLSNRPTIFPERVVQETDLRATKYREGLTISSRRPEVPASSFDSHGISVRTGDRSSPSKSSRGQSRISTPRRGDHGQIGLSQRSASKPRKPPSSPVNDQSINPRRSADWLRKDRKLMNFTKFEPPSSPTTSIASRHPDKARRPAPRFVQVQVPQTPGSPMKLHPAKAVPAKTAQNTRVKSHGHHSPKPARSATSTSPKVSNVPALSPFQNLQHTHLPEELSVRIVNSSSQLPRFEYRRWPGEHPIQQEQTSLMQDESFLQEETVLEADSPLQNRGTKDPAPAASTSIRNQDFDTVGPNPAGPENIVVSSEPFAKETATQKTLSKETRFADEDEVAEGDATEEDIAEENVANEGDTSTHQHTELSGLNEENTTEPNTCDNLPSAQRVPPPLGVSDRVTSLHSTALPKENSGPDSELSPDTQLSTQAALFHAQKSFQDDLDSPGYYNHQTPGQDRIVRSPNGSNQSTNVTPFYRLEESIRHELERSSKSTENQRRQAMSTQFMLDAATPFTFSTEQAGQDRSLKPTNRNITQAMNTQFMLDAATPYAFSTEKKQRASRPGSGSPMTRSSKRRRTANIESQSPSVRSQSIIGDNDYHTAESQSSGDENSPRPMAQQSDHPPTHQSATDASLPFTLSGSTPTTGQDGQGAHQGVESFNLSQAIADAGSWLQQSFDFVKDSGPSQDPKTILTSGARPPRSMDLSQ